MPTPLRLIERNVQSHFDQIEAALRAAVGAGVDLRVDVAWEQEPITASLGGPACEPVRRNRGQGQAQVVPLLRITEGMWAWLGFHEEWAFERVVGGARSYSFRSISLTVHFGWKNDAIKPQIFRAEWAGLWTWSGKDYGFQGKNAGHPHWQFDVLESLLTEKSENDAKDLLELLRGDDTEDVEAKEFQPAADHGVITDIVRAQKLSKIHFASAAPWWRSNVAGAHAHAPENAQQLQIWVTRTVAYIREELSRLQTS